MAIETSGTKVSLGRRLLRGAGTVAGTLLTLAVAAGLVAVGADWIAARAAQAEAQVASDPVPVAAEVLVPQDGYEVRRRFVGQIEPAQQADLSFELSGRLVEITVDEGDRIGEGGVIARLDTALLDTEAERIDAALRAVEAQLDFAEKSVARRTALEARGFSSDEALDRAVSERDALTAQAAQLRAERASVAVRLEKSVLRAPFDGQVGVRTADLGATVSPGQTVVSLFETGTVRIRVGLPSWIDPQAHRAATAVIAGRDVAATLHAVRPDIDPATRTRTAIFETAPGAAAKIGLSPGFGQTASLTLARHIQAEGVKVPVAALREGVHGTWTLLVVGENAVARAAAVEVLHTDGETAFVAGALPHGARVILAGPHRVTPGQTVRIAGDG